MNEFIITEAKDVAQLFFKDDPQKQEMLEKLLVSEFSLVWCRAQNDFIRSLPNVPELLFAGPAREDWARWQAQTEPPCVNPPHNTSDKTEDFDREFPFHSLTSENTP